MLANYAIDVRSLLPEIHAPTLVLNRRADRIAPAAAGRYMAERIPGARFVELEGEDHLMWVGDVDRLCSEIEEFVTRLPVSRSAEAAGFAPSDTG